MPWVKATENHFQNLMQGIHYVGQYLSHHSLPLFSSSHAYYHIKIEFYNQEGEIRYEMPHWRDMLYKNNFLIYSILINLNNLIDNYHLYQRSMGDANI
jgi:hypothetical protein